MLPNDHSRFVYIGVVTLAIIAGALLAHIVYGAVASSTNYRIERDVFSSGGVGNSTTSNYIVNFTVGEQGSGRATTTSYILNAGFQQLDGSFLSITSPSDVSLGSIANTGTAATSSASWTVTTNNSAGYQMGISGSTDPVLRCISTCTYSASDATTYFQDFNNGSTSPIYTFSPAASESLFGVTVSGSHTVQKFKNNGASCNQSGGTASGTACWIGLSTTTQTIAQSASATPSGTATAVYARAQIGSSHSQSAGSYRAVVTVTATAL